MDLWNVHVKIIPLSMAIESKYLLCYCDSGKVSFWKACMMLFWYGHVGGWACILCIVCVVYTINSDISLFPKHILLS